jgi:molybdopterin-containing oxidoreductase family iron-sulfur binding subunit
MSARPGSDLDALRGSLAGSSGPRFWRSLDELARTERFQELLRREFPALAPEWSNDVTRRHFLTTMGASLALAGLVGCTRQPKETIAPYAQAPEALVPGRPLHYATALTLMGFAKGVLVETHDGRPTKVEGNPDHPASLGASDVYMQAATLGLYDPDRSRAVTHLGEIRPFGDLLEVFAQVVEAQGKSGGAGLRILTETVTSPTLAALLRGVLQRYPAARWHQYEPLNRDHAAGGARLAFGEPLHARFDFSAADVVLALDADPCAPGPGSLRAIREIAARRRPADGGGMNRIYVVESSPTNTGAIADHRLPLASGDIPALARGLAARLLPEGGGGADLPGHLGGHGRWLDAVAADLRRHEGRSLVLAGDRQPAAVHALAHLLNDRLGNLGRTVVLTDPVEAAPVEQIASLAGLVAEMRAGSVEALLILGGNPVYTAPADLDFAAALESVGLRVHLGLHQDETAALSHWHVPQAHELEAWSDARADDGTVTILQPMIAPLYDGRTPCELLAVFDGRAGRPPYDLVRDHWREQSGSASFEEWWQQALHAGMVPESAAPRRAVPIRNGLLAELDASGWERTPGLEIAFAADPSTYDGRFANNGWLQELPRPITRLTWGNAALISPQTAARLGLGNGDRARLRHGGREIEAPIWIVPGQAADTVTLPLGGGRRRAGRVGSNIGFDAYALRVSAAPWLAGGAEMVPAGGREPLACTQEHHAMEGRGLVRHATLREYGEHPDFARHAGHDPEPEATLYPDFKYEGHAWGMVIDLNACVGCNACVIGCQAENNIPVVGREEVASGREMHWIRIDRYFEGDPERPAIWQQPVPCMHCENAPCEPVCPVGATSHSSEGLNDMVYNRCVGTRYCANNCPYKVRRFNFLLYADFDTPSLKALRNPDVSVRSRGVMEKCTYCVQRINRVRVEASAGGRPIRDGEVQTACQQACPARAISFGDLNDKESGVSRRRADPRNYGLLTDLNTRPRTTYLAALRNPNPDLEEA